MAKNQIRRKAENKPAKQICHTTSFMLASFRARTNRRMNCESASCSSEIDVVFNMDVIVVSESPFWGDAHDWTWMTASFAACSLFLLTERSNQNAIYWIFYNRIISGNANYNSCRNWNIEIEWTFGRIDTEVTKFLEIRFSIWHFFLILLRQYATKEGLEETAGTILHRIATASCGWTSQKFYCGFHTAAETLY